MGQQRAARKLLCLGQLFLCQVKGQAQLIRIDALLWRQAVDQRLGLFITAQHGEHADAQGAGNLLFAGFLGLLFPLLKQGEASLRNIGRRLFRILRTVEGCGDVTIIQRACEQLDRAAVRVFAQYRLDRPHARVKALVVKYLMQPAGNGKLLLARRVAAEIEKCVHGQAERAGQRRQQRDIRIACAGFPLADCGGGHAYHVSERFLRHPFFAACLHNDFSNLQFHQENQLSKIGSKGSLSCLSYHMTRRRTMEAKFNQRLDYSTAG